MSVLAIDVSASASISEEIKTRIHPARVLPMLRLNEIQKRYPNLEDPLKPLEILNEINLVISAGEVIALSGPSGCGKSTLLQIISGNLSATTGEIWWGEERLDQMNEAQRARWRLEQVGMIFQDFRLFPHLTVLENAALPLELLGASPQEALRGVKPLLEELGLGARLHHTPSALSGGEQQRVALARALAHRPTLLLADEPTGNLDQVSARAVEDLLLSLPTLRRVALIYVTHDLRFAARADRHFGVFQGQLMERSE